MIPLPVFILIPIAACIIEFFLDKLKVKYNGLLPLVSALATTALSIYIAFDTPENFNLLWIHQWGIDVEFSINGISNLFIAICSIAFLTQTILSLNKQKKSLYWCMNLLLQAAIFSFILTQNLAFRVISWELCWIPAFVILINTEQGHAAVRFSKIWFLAQTLLICGTIIIMGKFSRLHEVAFWLMLASLIIRTQLNVSNRFKPEITILINIIMPLLPIFFFINTITPIFQNHIITYTSAIAIFICLVALIWILKLISSKAISSIYTVNVLVFSSLMIVWLLIPELQILQLCIQMIIAKTILNIIMTYYAEDCRYILNKWVFMISLLLSFGFSGAIIGKPIFKILSLWGIYQQGIAIGMLFLILILFITTFIKASALFNKQPLMAQKSYPEIIKLVAVLLIFLGIAIASVDPTNIDNSVRKYTQNNLTGAR